MNHEFKNKAMFKRETQSRQLNWARHLQRNRWIGSVKGDLQELGVENWKSGRQKIESHIDR